MVFELDALQRNLGPLLPSIGQKLVSDLLSTGVPAKRLSKVIGRQPTYVTAVSRGAKVLTAANIVALVRFASHVNGKGTNNVK